MNLQEIKDTPTEFMEEITDKEFLKTISGEETPFLGNPQTEAKTSNEFNFNSFENGAPIPNPEGPSTNVNVKEIVSGELATDLINRILPVVLALAARRFLDLDVSKKQFELNASEKNTIAPIMDKCLSTLNVSFENPFMALALSMGFIYGSKFIDIANNPDLQKATEKVKKEAKTASIVMAAPAEAGKGPQIGSRGQALTRKVGETRGRKPKVLKFN